VRDTEDWRAADRLHGLSFSLIHLRPALSATVPEVGWRARGGRCEPLVDGAAQYSKACEGATLPWVQIPPPPPRTFSDARSALVSFAVARPAFSSLQDGMKLLDHSGPSWDVCGHGRAAALGRLQDVARGRGQCDRDCCRAWRAHQRARKQASRPEDPSRLIPGWPGGG
jgi:hypothetical protein